MKKMGKTAVVVMILLLLVAWPAKTWDGHDLITRFSLQNYPALELVLEESPYVYDHLDSSEYNPAFVMKYLHGDKENLTALDVLQTYASEPDWDLDTDLELSPFQILTGGSQGWRHQRYTLLWGLIALGVAPERTQHFYDLALLAWEADDPYWAFRFLARSLHYLQDMGQPYHSLPMPVHHLATKHFFNLDNAITVATNAHYNLEYYGEYRLIQGYEPFVAALVGSDVVAIHDVEQAARDLNKDMRALVKEQYALTMAVWPQLQEPFRQDLDFFQNPPEASPDLAALDEIMILSLQRTAAYTRGLIEKFMSDINGW